MSSNNKTPLLLKHGRILQGESLIHCDVLIEQGLITKMAPQIEDIKAQTIDCKGLWIAPGFIDLHVHLREPGFEHKETIETGTMAAAKGGYTTICPMPNTNPVLDSKHLLEAFKKRVKETAHVHVLPYASITSALQEEGTLVDMEALVEDVAGFSNDGVGIQHAAHMYHAMNKAQSCEALIAAHCEDENIVFGGFVHRGIQSKKQGWASMTSLPESIQIARDVLIAEETNARYHVCHISTKEGVRIVKDAKERGLKITCEVTPHHLLLVANDVADTDFKMNPPLRQTDDKYALIKALLEGTIDCIATDHAPHAPYEKALSMEEAPFGIVGLETAFPLIYTHFVRTKLATLSQLIAWFSLAPAKILNLKQGQLVEGRIADLTLIDLHQKKTIDKHHFVSKGKNTPFHGVECFGWPVMTLVSGKVVYQDAAFKG